GGEARLVEEHLDDVRIARSLDVDLLDDDVALEAFDAGRAREQHLRHAAARQMLDDLVTTERTPVAIHVRILTGPTCRQGAYSSSVSLPRRAMFAARPSSL